MARIPASELEDLKRRVDLVGLIRARGVELRKHGAKDLVGRCPFHDDQTPSLVVTPSKNLWHCLGACQAGGTAIDWIMKAEGVSFRHAALLLRESNPSVLFRSTMGPRIATVPQLPCPLDSGAEEGALLDQVVGFYHETLKREAEALSYLEARGLRSGEAIETFRLGYANRTLGLRLPDRNRKAGAELRDRLTRLGVYRASGHEHLAGSLVIPIPGPDGRTANLYGRKVRDDLREGTAYHLYLPGPHRGVWNPDGLRLGAGTVILCEALIDALSFWVEGFRNVTASYGTAGFTEAHLTALLQAGVHTVLIAYDADEAGDRAAEKLAGRLIGEGLRALRVEFPRGRDVNAFVVATRPARLALQALIERAVPLGASAERGSPALKPARPADSEGEPSTAISSLAAPFPPAPAFAEGPPAPKADRPTQQRGEDVIFRFVDREYRARGLRKNPSPDTLKISLRVSREGRFHLDHLDLVQAKARAAYVAAATRELGVEADLLRRDIGRVLLGLEQLQVEEGSAGETTASAVPEMAPDEKEAALALLRSPRLLDEIVADFGRIGVIGEESNLLVGYLAATSRKLDQPLAVVIQSSSSAGKSSVLEAVLGLIPEEDRVKYSAMTGQSLYYLGRNGLRHKVLAIVEEAGAAQAAYALKLLQSEGELSIASTGKDPKSGRHVTHEYRVEGPVSIFLTTTAPELDEELRNRCLVLAVSDDAEQTRRVLAGQRAAETLEGRLAEKMRSRIRRRHRAAQRLLRPLLVVNPLAPGLTFASSRTRARRDQRKLLALMRAVALLHQHQRPLKSTEVEGELIEYIEVTSADVTAAQRLWEAAGLGSVADGDDLSPQARRLLGLLAERSAAEALRRGVGLPALRFTRREAREWCAWSDFQVRTHLQRLIALELVDVYRGGPGRRFEYALAPAVAGGPAVGLPPAMTPGVVLPQAHL